MVNKVINKLKADGFVKTNLKTINQKDLLQLSSLSKKILKVKKKEKANSPQLDNGLIIDKNVSEIILRLPEHDKKISYILNKILSNTEIKNFLSSLMGSKYKLWQIVFRRSLPGDPGMYLHQDAIGETNMCIALSNNSEGNGATIFLPSSHLIATRLKKWDMEIPHFILRYFIFLFSKLKIKKGDVAFFINRTWHGRSPNRSLIPSDVILISFFPSKDYFKKDKWSKKYLKEIKNTYLSELINHNNGRESFRKNNYPFVIQIENGEKLISKIKLMYIYTILLFFKLLFLLIKPIFRFLKNKRFIK